MPRRSSANIAVPGITSNSISNSAYVSSHRSLDITGDGAGVRWVNLDSQVVFDYWRTVGRSERELMESYEKIVKKERSKLLLDYLELLED